MDITSKGLAPISEQSVVDKTIKRIIDAITNGTYKVGQKLPNEYELISELQISRNSLREAMKVLSTIGIVEIKRGDGTYVCDQINPSVFDNVVYGLVFDISSSAELSELRRSFDEIMLRLSIEKATQKDIDELQHFIDLMRENLKKGNIKAAAEADYNFHIRMVDACQNKLLSRIIKGVYQFFRHSIEVNIKNEEDYAHAAEYHQALLNTIIDRDKARVCDVVATSLKSWSTNVKK